LNRKLAMKRAYLLLSVMLLFGHQVQAQTFGRSCGNSIAAAEPMLLRLVAGIFTEPQQERVEFRKGFGVVAVTPHDSVYVMKRTTDCAAWVAPVLAQWETAHPTAPPADFSRTDLALFVIGPYVAAWPSPRDDLPRDPAESNPWAPILVFERSTGTYIGDLLK
jgi:hypothetical protein